MSLMVKQVQRVVDPKLRTDDDRIDRLNHRYTSTMLIVFSVLVSSQQYVGRPIDCWAPVHFKGRHVDYANSYCWVSGTFHIPFNSSIPTTSTRYTLERSNYYQWVPIILLIQALLFNVPCLIWRSLSERSGLDLNSVVITGQMLATVQMTKQIRDGLHQRMLLQINRYIGSLNAQKLNVTVSIKNLLSRTICCLCGHRQGNYLTSLYITTKILYLLNSLGQLFALDLFMGQEYYLYGIEVVRAAMRGEDWTGSHRFPRVNLCDFKVRRMGNVHQHTLQCVLPINLFNEKIFLFMWFWLIFVSIINFIDLLFWCLKIFVPIDRTRFIKRHLMMSQDVSIDDSQEKKMKAVIFVEKHLYQDGVFLLRLLQQCTNVITVMELTSKLWNSYLEKSPLTGEDSNGPIEDVTEVPTFKMAWKHRVPKVPTAPIDEKEETPLPNSVTAEPNSKELEALLESNNEVF